ncbi:MAG: peptidylprolyl isomerase [Pyrinomonadaceae bacterium]|nr:peptidylprolyl isomerase [Pyrinomonadaceae bacterium]
MSFFLLLVFSSLAIAQEPTPTPAPTPAKKANQRPAETTPKNAEPFDNADVKTMAEKCVTLQTEAGDIQLEFFPETAPETVRNFLNLVAIKFYDTTVFSRVVPNFVVQGGNFSTRQERTMELYERSQRRLKDEPNQVKHERGIISMARSDEPDSATTHFFIIVADSASNLDSKFAAFGRVIKGMEIADAINKMPVVNEKPEKPVRLLKAVIEPCPIKTEQ